jgi:hypothetical protein
MMALIGKKCEKCSKRATFSYVNEIARRCKKHIEDAMIDVVNKRCHKCNKLASFGYEKNNPISCVKHTDDKMINIKKICCEMCNTEASYGNKNGKRCRCSKHKDKDMMDLVHKKCKILNCGIIANIPKYRGYCLNCFINVFPDEPVSRYYKIKEKHITDAIKTHFPNLTFICDKKIQNGCSSRRPDMLLQLDIHNIIIEIDENQHDTYDCSCNNRRIMEISQDLNHDPTVFIRFNPDDYLGKDGKNVTSCFGINGNGILTVKKTKKKELNHRLFVLCETIQYWIDNPSDKMVEVVELYYDQNVV